MKVLKQIVFFCLLGIIIVGMGKVLIAKDENYDKYKIFNGLEENSLDICYLGTSNSDAAINPEVIDEQLECSSFNYSVTGIRVQYLYYRILDLLKTQNPELLVIDTTTFIPIEPSTIDLLLRWTTNPLPLSFEKTRAINNLIGIENGLEYLTPYPLYHKRIFKLTTEDWQKAFNLYDYEENISDETVSMKGWKNLGNEAMEREDDYFLSDFSTITSERILEDDQEEYLGKILDLADEHNIKILFLSVPYKETQGFSALENVELNNYLRNNYKSDDVNFLDMNTMYNEMGFDYCYLKDEGHVNSKGAALISNYLREFISENYHFED